MKYGLPVFLRTVLSIGEALWEYEPETLAQIFPDQLDQEKALALANFVINDSAHTDWDIFLNTMVVLNDRHANFAYMVELSVAELCWGMVQLHMVDPVGKFSTEILGFIATILHEEGWVHPPSVLKDEESVEGIRLDFLLRTINSNMDYAVGLDEAQKLTEGVKNQLVLQYIDSHRQDLESRITELDREIV